MNMFAEGHEKDVGVGLGKVLMQEFALSQHLTANNSQQGACQSKKRVW